MKLPYEVLELDVDGPLDSISANGDHSSEEFVLLNERLTFLNIVNASFDFFFLLKSIARVVCQNVNVYCQRRRNSNGTLDYLKIHERQKI